MNTLLQLPRLVLFACVTAAWAGPAAADPLALAKSFEGNINFVGTQASLQTKNGGAKACDLKSSAEASITLPADATVLAAILYWAGTGEVDPEVSLNTKTVTAPAERRYVVLRFWGGMTTTEMRAEFGYDPKGLWATARERLRPVLADLVAA